MANQQTLTAQDLQPMPEQKPMDGFVDDINNQLSQQSEQQYVQQPQVIQQIPQQQLPPEQQIPPISTKQFNVVSKEEAMFDRFWQMLQEPIIIAIIYVIISQRVILSLLAKNIPSFSDKKTNITFLGLCIVGVIIGILFALTKQVLIKQKIMVA